MRFCNLKAALGDLFNMSGLLLLAFRRSGFISLIATTDDIESARRQYLLSWPLRADAYWLSQFIPEW
jgi:hypothetical protein